MVKRSRSPEKNTASPAQDKTSATAGKRPATMDAKVVAETKELVNQAKREAAYKAVDEEIRCTTDLQIVGVGSGSTVVFAVDRLAERVKKENLNLVCIPTSFQALHLIKDNGLVLGNLDDYPEIDITIDGADEITNELICIKGGGGCQTQEKIVAYNSKRMVVICDYTKVSEQLGTKWLKGIPIEVMAMAVEPVKRKLKALGGSPALRMAKAKAGPIVTDNGCLILDTVFSGDSLCNKAEAESLDNEMRAIPGVIETGLFIGLAKKAYVGDVTGGSYAFP